MNELRNTIRRHQELAAIGRLVRAISQRSVVDYQGGQQSGQKQRLDTLSEANRMLLDSLLANQGDSALPTRALVAKKVNLRHLVDGAR